MDRRPLARPHRGDARVHETDERPIGESSLTSRTRAPSWSLRSFERPGGDFFELTPSALPLSINRNRLPIESGAISRCPICCSDCRICRWNRGGLHELRVNDCNGDFAPVNAMPVAVAALFC